MKTNLYSILVDNNKINFNNELIITIENIFQIEGLSQLNVYDFNKVLNIICRKLEDKNCSNEIIYNLIKKLSKIEMNEISDNIKNIINNKSICVNKSRLDYLRSSLESYTGDKF